MKQELQEKLYEKYPDFFIQRTLPVKESLMAFGLECDDGWYELIEKTCSYIAFNIKHNDCPSIEFRQIKEKYGRLCLYYQYAASDKKIRESSYAELDGAISFAEYISGMFCEICGNPGVLCEKNHWYKTLCEKHMVEYNYSKYQKEEKSDE